MGRRVTTGQVARSFSFRLNPAIQEDADAIHIMDELIAAHFSIRQIMTDAILHGGGRTPEMYARQQSGGITADALETMLVRFLDEYSQQAHRQPRKPIAEQSADDTEEVSAWTRNFAKGFMARQSQVLGEDED